MKTELLMPQEVEVFYVIPAIRRELATVMKASGIKQKDIAKLLFVKESTISQYMTEKRAAEMKFSQKVKEAVALSANAIKDRVSLVAETQKLLRLVKEEKALCQIHTSISNIPKTCDVCFLK